MNTHPARGMRDFLPDDVRRREYVIGVIAEVYQRYGFEPLETPAVENIETLMGKYGEEGDRLIFRILKRGEEGKSGEADLALRYDLTVPLARVVAEYRAKLPKFFKRYQVQPVWRADRPQKGRFREFYQCDVDAIGSKSPVVEAELCAAVSDVLNELQFTDFKILISHRALLNATLKRNGVLDHQYAEVITIVDKLDKIGPQGVVNELIGRGYSEAQANAICGDFDAKGAPEQPFEHLDWWAHRLELAGHPAIENLKHIVNLAAATSARSHLVFEPSLARGLSYYTGAIFEIRVNDLAGSLGGGGRYDELIGMFSGQTIPAAGFSLGLERILVVMNERGMFKPLHAVSAADVLLTSWRFDALLDDVELQTEAMRLATRLRENGVRVEVFPEPDRDVGKQIKYASSRRIPYAIVVGASERQTGQVGLRDLVSRSQEVRTVDEVVKIVKKYKADGRKLKADG